MLHIFQSNKLEDLATLLARLLKQPKNNPLAPTPILVQSPGMGTWLKIELAQQNGIAAGLTFPLPSSFFEFLPLFSDFAKVSRVPQWK